MKGKAALYCGLDKGFTIEELPMPEVEPGGVLVGVSAASICGSDLHLWRRDMEFPAFISKNAGIEVDHYVLYGAPADVVLGFCGESQDCLAVMTIRGMSGIGTWVLGSVADRVVRHAEFPVLVIRQRDPMQEGIFLFRSPPLCLLNT